MVNLISSKCPKQCKCKNDEADIECNRQGITDELVVEIASQLDPTKVESLDFDSNDITNFPAKNFINFTKLESIYLSFNSLNKFPANISRFIPSVRQLRIRRNKINAIDRADFEGYHIGLLEISGNDIEKFDLDILQSIPDFGYIDVSSNKIKHLKKSKMQDLAQRHLNAEFADNDIEVIESGAFPLKMNFLNLNKNKLTASGIHASAFNDVDRIYLSYNKLKTVRREWFVSFPRYLDLSSNPLVCDCALYGVMRAIFFRDSEGTVEGKCNSTIDINDFYTENRLNCSPCLGYSGEHCQILLGEDEESPGLGVGYIVVIMVLVVFVLFAVIGVAFYVKRRRRYEKTSVDETTMANK